MYEIKENGVTKTTNISFISLIHEKIRNIIVKIGNKITSKKRRRKKINRDNR